MDKTTRQEGVNPQLLAGKVALVTGGSRGIGAAIVKRLACDGADVVFSYSSSHHQAEQLVKEIEEMGRRVIAIKADQAVAIEVENLVKKAHAVFGKLDILVNSAGVYVSGMVGDPSVDITALDRQLDINIKGVVTAVRTAVPLLGDGGRIVSIGSVAAFHAPFLGVSDYGATKAALAGYTRGWSRDLGARNITVNIIHPGPINTDMNPDDGPTAQKLKGLIPLGRYGQPEEIAAAVAFLVGPDAGYITGAALTVDGGVTA